GVAKENALHTGDFTQFPGQIGLKRNLINIGAMDQETGLLADGLSNSRVGVAQTANSDTAEGIEVFVALSVEKPCAFPPLKRDRNAAIGVHQRLVSHVFIPL